MAAYGYGEELQCCKGVVDPITLLALLGTIAGITAILRYYVLLKITGRKKRSLLPSTDLPISFVKLIWQGESKKQLKLGLAYILRAINYYSTTNLTFDQ